VLGAPSIIETTLTERLVSKLHAFDLDTGDFSMVSHVEPRGPRIGVPRETCGDFDIASTLLMERNLQLLVCSEVGILEG
jgi:hypothetical protein